MKLPLSCRKISKKPFNSIIHFTVNGSKNILAKRFLEAPGIDPGTSRMLSERSTI